MSYPDFFEAPSPEKGEIYAEVQEKPKCDLAQTRPDLHSRNASSCLYKSSKTHRNCKDFALGYNMERFNAEQVARYFVHNNYLGKLPRKLSSVCKDLVDTGFITSLPAAETSIRFLQSALPSSVVIEHEISAGEFLTFFNVDVLSYWLNNVMSAFSSDTTDVGSSFALAPSVYLDDNENTWSTTSEHSCESSTCSTTATSVEFYEFATHKKGGVREQLAAELRRMEGSGVVSMLALDFESLILNPTSKENEFRAERIQRTCITNFIEICPHNDPAQCLAEGRLDCRNKLHLDRVVNSATDESLGDCNYLDTCFKGRSCRYVHYRVQMPANRTLLSESIACPPKMPSAQWIQCDLQKIELSKMGNDYGVIIADPPWDIHMNTSKSNANALRDSDIANLAVGSLQNEGIIFLWVTGRALDSGRQCLKNWGYTHTEELVWLKINQLGRTIGTGRTGHWFNHTKEHVLVGVKGKPGFLARQLDVDTLVSMSRGNSRKPEELYNIIERLVGDKTRKLELFGRENNLRPGWLTLGSELKGVQLNDPLLKFRWARASK